MIVCSMSSASLASLSQEAGQTVFHVHGHVLTGEPLDE